MVRDFLVNHAAAAAKSLQSCLTLCDRTDGSPPSLGFSRQEHWSGLLFPSPMHWSEKWKWSRFSRVRLCDPIDCSLPGSSIHGIFQARVVQWGAIAFSVWLITKPPNLWLHFSASLIPACGHVFKLWPRGHEWMFLWSYWAVPLKRRSVAILICLPSFLLSGLWMYGWAFFDVNEGNTLYSH